MHKCVFSMPESIRHTEATASYPKRKLTLQLCCGGACLRQAAIKIVDENWAAEAYVEAVLSKERHATTCLAGQSSD